MEIRIKKILEYAIMAPSGDNCQPWKFRIHNKNLNLFNDPNKDSSLYNIKQRASLIAHGALLENIRIASSSVGLQAEIQLFPDTKNENHIAAISFAEGETRPHLLLGAIPKRHTNREAYSPTVISNDQINNWQALTSDSRQKIWCSNDKQLITKLTTLLSYNDRLVFEVQDLHRFLFEQIRWSDTQVQTTRDGLDRKTLGLNALDKFSFQFLKNWSLVSILNTVGLSKIIQIKAKKLLKTASSFAIITIPGSQKQDYVQGGHIWQRLLLKLACENLSVQPIAGLACLMQNALEDMLLEKITTKQQADLLYIRQELLHIINADEHSTILAIFRIGNGPNTTKALRKPVKSFLLP